MDNNQSGSGIIALASDHAGYDLKEEIKQSLIDWGYEFFDYGTGGTESCDYPEYAYKAAKAVASGECGRGLLFCGTGVGVSITANKVRGIRCACCSEPYSALMSRQHNDVNMLALGSRVVGADLARMIVRTWLEAEFLGGRHSARVDMINRIDETGVL